MKPRAFILPVALAMAALIAVVVIFCAGLLRRGLAPAERAMVQARAQALYGLDVALAQLQAVAAADTSSTAPASILGGVANSGWVGAWAQGSPSPTWLVSGSSPSPLVNEPTLVTSNLRAPLVTTSQGSYAYAVEDLSTRVTQKDSRWSAIPTAFNDTQVRLQQQTVSVLNTQNLSASKVTPMSYGLLTNPVGAGWKLDLDTPNAANSSDEITKSVALWRNPIDIVAGRPPIWAEAAVLMGVYKNSDGTPLLGLAFWADAWNPTLKSLTFNSTGIPDLRLRLQGPAGTVRYFNAGGALVGFERLDLAAHTSSSPILTDLYGPMSAGEIRFITHYRLQPISADSYPDSTSVQIDIPAGDWDFIFETLEGQPIQKISGFSYAGISRRFGYGFMSVQNLNPNTCQWVFSWKLREPMTTLMTQNDPRAREIIFNNNYYNFEADPVRAQTNFNSFSTSDLYRNANAIKLFDVPEGSLVSAGSLQHMALPGAAALSLGTSAATSANDLFDKYFFSSLPASADVLGTYIPSAALTLPNVNLRLTGTPSFNDLRAQPASSLLLQGAFNINTLDADTWLAILPATRAPFPFRTDLPTQPIAIPVAQRQSWAQAIVSRLAARGTPWRSVSQLAAEDILPPEVFCQLSALLQPRGDTFYIHVVGRSPGGAVAALRALVQRLPSADGTLRRFQILSQTWVTPPAQL